MDLVDQEGQAVPAASEAVASEEVVEVVGASEAVSRVGVEVAVVAVVVVASRVETGSRSEGAADPEAGSVSKEATEAPTATVGVDTMAGRPHQTHPQGLEDAEEAAVGMAVATTEVLVEGTKAGPVGMVIGVAEATIVAAGLEGMIATAVTGVAVGVIGMATAMALVLVLVLVPVPVLVLVLAQVQAQVPVLEVEGLADIEATIIGVVGPTEIGARMVIEVLMATGVRTVIVAAMIGVAMEVMMRIRESARTRAAMEGMVAAIGTGEGISSVIC